MKALLYQANKLSKDKLKFIENLMGRTRNTSTTTISKSLGKHKTFESDILASTISGTSYNQVLATPEKIL